MGRSSTQSSICWIPPGRCSITPTTTTCSKIRTWSTRSPKPEPTPAYLWRRRRRVGQCRLPATAGEMPQVDYAMPSGGRLGETVEFELAGVNLSSVSRVTLGDGLATGEVVSTTRTSAKVRMRNRLAFHPALTACMWNRRIRVRLRCRRRSWFRRCAKSPCGRIGAT